jgi:hypothetical protein
VIETRSYYCPCCERAVTAEEIFEDGEYHYLFIHDDVDHPEDVDYCAEELRIQ